MADPRSHNYSRSTGVLRQGVPPDQPFRNPTQNVMPGVPGTGYQQMTPKQQTMPTPNSSASPPGAVNTAPNMNFGRSPQSSPSQGYVTGAVPRAVGVVNPQTYGQLPVGNTPMSFTDLPGVASPPRNMLQQSPPQAPPGARMMMVPSGGQMAAPPLGGQAGIMPQSLAKSQSSPLPSSQQWQSSPGGIRMALPPTVNGISSPQTRMSQPPMRGGAPPMPNGPAQVPPTSRMQTPPPPRIGEAYQKPVLMPPVSQHYQASGIRGPSPQQVPPPPRVQQPGMMGPPPLGMPPGNAPPSGRPAELPVPYHGSAQYSHQLHENTATPTGLTPNVSGPPSQKSSRAPSPIPGPTYDAMEGQFAPSQPAPGYPAGIQQRPPPSQQQPPLNQQPPLPQQQQLPPLQQPPLPQQLPPSQQPAYPAPGPPPTSADQTRHSITGRRQYPSMGTAASQAPGPLGAPMGSAYGTQQQQLQQQQQYQQQQQQQQPVPGGIMANNTQSGARTNALNSSFNSLSLQSDSSRPLNLLQDRHILPAGGITAPLPNLPRDLKKLNCSTDVFRCTLTSVPNTQSLLNKSRLPFGILIHPFKDLNQLPVIQSSVIVRCRSCRTYINPFVSFIDMHRWKCNLCYRVNELPEEFNYDPISKTYGEPHRRPEVRSGTIEFIAPSEYMLRPPQPAVYLYVLDVSFNAIETGYLALFCQNLLEELERIPGDLRTQIGFLTFDRSLHFYSLDEDHSQPQMLVVSDVDDVFLPTPDGLLVNLNENRQLVTDLLKQLPAMFEKNMETGSALGPALQAAYKLLSATGGRVQVVQSQLPTVGPGALQCREDPNERAGKKIQHLGPAIDFYKKMALDCSAQQIAVDLFFINAQYADISTIACVSKYSGGCIHYFPSLHTLSNAAEAERFEACLRRYVSRKIGFESVMRIRCTRGLSIHTFHGNFFVRSTDLLSLPNVNPEAGFGMQLSIEDTIESNYACFQAALLYTSSKGERRIRVHTLCLPITSQVSEVLTGADQQAVIALLAKMGVDRSLSASINDAREAFINVAIDVLNAYGSTMPAAQRIGQLLCPVQLRLIPVYILALLKSTAFRVGASTKLDDRVVALEEFKTLPVSFLLMQVYPHLYPVHMLDDKNCLSKGDLVVPQPPLLQLSSANIDRHGAYLMDTGSHMYLWLGAAVSDRFCEDVFEQPNFKSVQDNMVGLPELENQTSEMLVNFINHLNEQRPFAVPVTVIREDGRMRHVFIERLIEDRTDSTFSYYEFLQHLQKETKS